MLRRVCSLAVAAIAATAVLTATVGGAATASSARAEPAPIASAAPETVGLARNLFYGFGGLDTAGRIAQGQADPLIGFKVEADPPSAFYDFIVPDDRAAAFATEASLPPGFTLAKLRILDDDPAPHYWLSLNVYRVSGITSGLRAEWSTYVDAGDGRPHYMIIDAWSDGGSLDPVDIVTQPTPFAHRRDGDVVQTDMDKPTTPWWVQPAATVPWFHATIPLGPIATRHQVQGSTEWITANDSIYWRNGVADRGFHDGTVHHGVLWSIPPATVTIDDRTRWAPFVDAVPGHVEVFGNELHFVVSPWANLHAPEVALSDAQRYERDTLRRGLYSSMTSTLALATLFGASQPVEMVHVDAAAPSATTVFALTPAGQATVAGRLPHGLTLAPMRVVTADPAPRDVLCLRVQHQSGIAGGTVAEWFTYATDATGTAHEVTLWRATDTFGPDPFRGFAAPSAVAHRVDGARLTSTVGGFGVAVAWPPAAAATASPTRDAVAARDVTIAANGITSSVGYDGAVLDARLVDIAPDAVVLAGTNPWAGEVEPTPLRTLVTPTAFDLAVTPFTNAR